jgi:hypothetical protein
MKKDKMTTDNKESPYSNNSKSITFRHLARQYGRAVAKDIKNCVEDKINRGLISEEERQTEEVSMISERLDALLEKCRDKEAYEEDINPKKKSSSKKLDRNTYKKINGNKIKIPVDM